MIWIVIVVLVLAVSMMGAEPHQAKQKRILTDQIATAKCAVAQQNRVTK